MEIRPRFREDLIKFDQRGEGADRIIVLKDPVSEKYFRLSPFEYKFLRTLDGSRSLEEGLEAFKAGGHYCSPEEAQLILAKASQAGLVLGTKYSSARYQLDLKERFKKARRAQRFSSVYFLFIPLLNPDRFLGRTLWFFRLLANRVTAVAMAALTPMAMYLVITGIPRMELKYLFFFNFQNLLMLWITIAFTKLIHEFSHAYTAKSFGLRVPQMGVAFLIFFPCLYCNTTDAWQLADRRQRMIISAAGIVSEAVLAVLSTYVWTYTRPGMLNSLAFYLMAVSFVSTLIFNGNPLLKFDGYFIVSDYLRLPNLQSKSFAYIKHMFMNRLLGMAAVTNPASNARQARIFGAYGVCSFIYRIFLYTGIVAGVYYRFDKTLGIALAILAFALFVVRPVVRGVRSLFVRRSEIRLRARGMAFLVALVGGVLLILLVPMSSMSVYPCYVASALTQKLTVPLGTSISKVFVREWMTLDRGQVLFELDSSMLELALVKKNIEREILLNELTLVMLDPQELGKAESKGVQLNLAQHEIGKIKEELALAEGGVVAPFAGVVTRLDFRVQPGFRPGEGAVIGELESLTDCEVRALIPEQDRQKVSLGQKVEIWFPLGGGVTFHKRIDSIKTHNEANLKDSPFSSRIGGELATEVRDENAKDVPLVAQYVCSTHLDNSERTIPLGITGRFAVPSPPRSMLAKMMDKAYRTFSRESLF